MDIRQALQQKRLPVDEVFPTAAAHALCNTPRSRKVYSRSNLLLHHSHRLCASSAETRLSAIYFRGNNTEAFYRLLQRSNIHRFGQVLVHACFPALLHILCLLYTSGVNLMALYKMFSRIWFSRSGSVMISSFSTSMVSIKSDSRFAETLG